MKSNRIDSSKLLGYNVFELDISYQKHVAEVEAGVFPTKKKKAKTNKREKIVLLFCYFFVAGGIWLGSRVTRVCCSPDSSSLRNFDDGQNGVEGEIKLRPARSFPSVAARQQPHDYAVGLAHPYQRTHLFQSININIPNQFHR